MKPSGCVCDPKEWAANDVTSVCSGHVGADPDSCLVCDHRKACHQPPAESALSAFVKAAAIPHTATITSNGEPRLCPTTKRWIMYYHIPGTEGEYRAEVKVEHIKPFKKPGEWPN